LNGLAMSLNHINYFFKTEIFGENWEMEKFSLKDASMFPNIEKYAL
jgi:hypothetical protein